MHMAKKTMQIHTTMDNLEEIKQLIRDMRGLKVSWEKNRDGRKQQITCKGVIEATYDRHFSIRTAHGHTSFTYVDLLVKDVILERLDTGKDILDELR